MVTIIRICNPETGALVEQDISGLTAEQLQAIPLDEKLCEEIAAEVAPCLPEEFLAAYVVRVGVVEAGRCIVGAWIDQMVRDWLPLELDTPAQPT
jgi:hypothetical protein